MAGEWREVAVGEFTPFAYGKGLPERDRNAAGLVPVYGSNGVVGYHDMALTDGPTVVIGRKGTAGAVHYSSRPCWPIDTTFYVVGRDEALTRYRYYLLKSLGLEHMNADSAVPGLNRDAAHARLVEVPVNVEEQRAIAHILGTLDDKIELNRRMSATLEEMARALFKSWFIDFEPVRRNAARARNQPSPLTPLPGGEGGTTHYRAGFDFSGLIETARELRRKQTPAEAMLWEVLRDRRFMGLKFRRQHQLGDYVVDFYCHELCLVLELDGGIHASKRDKDHKRDAWLKARGYKVLRFPNEQLWDDPDTVLRTLADVVKSTEPNPPSPSGRRVGDEGSVEELDRLFPARLVDSELGPIPEGWGVGTLGEILEQLRDHVNPLSDPASRFLHFSIPAFDEGQSPKLECGEEIKSQKWRVPPGVVLLSKLNPEIERVWLVDVKPDDRAVCSTEFLVLRPKPPFGRAHVYCLTRSPFFRQQIEGLVTGTSKSHQRAQPGAILKLAAIKPPAPVLTAFDRATGPLLNRTLECRLESRTLSALRDALLPKLISGKIRVKDAERFCEERKL